MTRRTIETMYVGLLAGFAAVSRLVAVLLAHVDVALVRLLALVVRTARGRRASGRGAGTVTA